VRQLGAAGAPSRGRILMQLLGALDASVAPLAIDEIGMSGDAPMATILMAIAGGEIPALASPYLQVKACEALGRLKSAEALPLLERIACDSSGEREMAMVACEAIERVDQAAGERAAHAAGIRAAEFHRFLAESFADSPGVRNRLYKRIKLPRPASARLSSPDGEFSVQVQQLSLGGGTLTCASPLPAGATGRLRMQWGSLAISAKVILRGPRGEHIAFEIFDIDLEERYKLRKFLAGVVK
jgi:PilZ domain